MSTATGAADERRSQTRAVIDRMLTERQQMLVLYERVAGVAPFEGAAVDAELLKKFSQILIDYVAAGHFGLYDRITEGKERRRRIVDLAQELYPRIARTTDAVVDFNDAYDSAAKSNDFRALAVTIVKLGEELAVRIDLEDRIIEQLLAR